MGAVLANREERTGLAVAVLAHLALLGVLVFRPPSGDVVMPPERIEVTISDDIGLTSTSPDPLTDAAPDVAPVIGEEPEPVVPDVPQPVVQPAPVPSPVRPDPPRPAVRATSQPTPRRTQAPPPKPPVKPAPPRTVERSGGSRIGNDFLDGTPGAQSTQRSSSPRAAEIGPRVKAALAGAVSRQLKPHWSAPQGPEAEEIVTILAWNLNADGSLDGTPTVVRQLGVNDVNRNQAPRHAEQAIRAVQLAAPFNLPPEFYDGWKRIAAFRFDKRLSQ